MTDDAIANLLEANKREIESDLVAERKEKKKWVEIVLVDNFIYGIYSGAVKKGCLEDKDLCGKIVRKL